MCCKYFYCLLFGSLFYDHLLITASSFGVFTKYYLPRKLLYMNYLIQFFQQIVEFGTVIITLI